MVAGACYKGMVELRELGERGFREYFASKGAGFLDNVLSLSYFGCIMTAVARSVMGYVTAVLAARVMHLTKLMM